MSSFSLWSHPGGKLLKDHLCNVLAEGRARYANLPLNDDLRQLLDLSLMLHDLGKATGFFQTYIRAVDQDWQTRQKLGASLGRLKNHAQISALWGLLLGRDIWGEASTLPLTLYLCVLKHHGCFQNRAAMYSHNANDLANFHKMNQHLDYAEFSQILALNGFTDLAFNQARFAQALDEELFNAKHRRWCKRMQRKAEALWTDQAPNLELFFQTSFTFSLLLTCDKGECIFDGLVPKRRAPLPQVDQVDRYKQKQFGHTQPNDLNQLREAVYQNTVANLKQEPNARLFSLNLPTGLGKTLISLNLAIKLLHMERGLEKIVYCLPFTSVIDQNAEVFKAVLACDGHPPSSEALLLYHHLTELEYKRHDLQTNADEIDQYQGEFLITQFESHINVTTFYQLLHAFFTGKNREIRKLSSLANSVVILDEVQTIPFKYWLLVRHTFLEAAQRFNITFILVTATMPMIFKLEEVTELVSDKEAIFAHLNRIRLDASQLKPGCEIQLETFAEQLETQIADDQSVLIILNTKQCTEDLYERLSESALKDRLLFLSTNIAPYQRLARIQKIKQANHARKADKPFTAYVVISTQLVEAGVDIDMDVVYRDLAPLDAIFQAAGRCNRNDDPTRPKGEVRLVNLVSENGRSYAGMIYDSVNLHQTKKILCQQDIHHERHFLHLANDYFQALKDTKSQADSDNILKAMAQLNYDDAFNPTFKNKKANITPFELIEQQDTVPALVMIEPEAQRLAEAYEALRLTTAEMTPHDRKWAYKEMLRKMAPYMVSIPKAKTPHELVDTHFLYVGPEYGSLEYHPVTGLKLGAHNTLF